jgi:hypothetical protein
VQVKDRLAGSRTNVNGHAIVLETHLLGRPRDELEHALRLVRRKLADLLEARDVPLGKDEQVHIGLWVDVANGDEAVGGVDVIAVGVQVAEEAVVRQRGFPPRSRHAPEHVRIRRPDR